MRKLRPLWLMGILLVVIVMGAMVMAQQNNANGDERYVGTVPAPAFPDDLDWLNVENPLTMDGLRGKIVILDFWTYGCINCLHMIPTLERLEQKYADEIIVIGVHSNKFENEGETENIRQIVQRYDIHHPVINDNEFAVWRQYRARAWPTFFIIDPRGNIVAMQEGEIAFDAFDQYIGAMVNYYDELGEGDIDRTPIELALEGAGDPGTPLLFPGKVLPDTANNRLFIADTNHHRIVIADLQTYTVEHVIGSGERGFEDGDYTSATFNKLHGMALNDDGTVLYVADTNNHAIRAIDLDAQTVSTIAGNGIKGAGVPPFSTVIDTPLDWSLRSPWDVWHENGQLHIAMAGTHQLWVMNLDDNTLQASVGNGREAQFNARLANSELAQPSDLFLTGDLLYFADSESSTIRVADLADDAVQVASGTISNSLFDYGDIDGDYGVNRLQHPLGVTGTPDGERIYIADTYNNKIKLYDPETQTTTTLFGLGGNGGFRDGDAQTAQFDEPGDVAYADDRLYVADTNNHAIRVIDLNTNIVHTITFPNPEALKIERNAVTIVGGNATQGETVTLEAQTVSAGDGELVVNLMLPEGYKINDLIDSTLTLTNMQDVVSADNATTTIDETSISVPLTFSAGETTLTAVITLYYCEAENERLCLIDDVTLQLPVIISAEADNATLTIERTVQLPELAGSGL